MLRCDPPIVLDAGPNIQSGALAAYQQGFLAGVARDLIVVNQVNFDAGVSFVFSRQKLDAGVYTNAQLALDTRGSEWLAVWLQPMEDHALCMTSRDGSTNQVRVAGGGNLARIDAAISADGGIAVAAQRQSIGAPLLGAQGAACPATLAALPYPAQTLGASVVSTNDGFRYVYSGLSGQPPGSSSGHVIVGTLTDAGLPGYFSTLSRPEQTDAVASTGGDRVLVAYNSATSNLVSLLATSVGGAYGVAVPVTTERPGSWSVSRCGAGCAVTGVVPYEPLVPVTLSFFTDALTPSPQGSWDLICNTPGFAVSRTTLWLATSGGRLGALVTTPTSSLYLCDLPPGPP